LAELDRDLAYVPGAAPANLAAGHVAVSEKSDGRLTMQRAGWRQRGLGAALALLVQAGFVLLVLLSPSRPSRLKELPLETILLFPPLAVPAPSTIDARGPRKRRNTAPGVIPLQPPVVPAPSAAPSLAPPSGLAGFGRSLFGCAPEKYGQLTPEERSHCPKPGEGLARNNDRDLATPPRSRSKLEAVWQEQWAEDHWVPTPCLPDPTGTAVCLLRQSIAENHRAQAAWGRIAADKEKALREPVPKPPLANIGTRKN
jgi:hypothetical protein